MLGCSFVQWNKRKKSENMEQNIAMAITYDIDNKHNIIHETYNNIIVNSLKFFFYEIIEMNFVNVKQQTK